MKKQLLIIRHAKAEEFKIGLDDFNRDLTNKGHMDACKVGKAIKEEGITTDIIFSSQANRAAQTAQLVTEQWDSVPNISYHKHLYHISTENLMQFLNKVDEQYNRIAIVGHNPDLSFFSEYLINENIYLKTSGTVLINFQEKKWKEIKQYSGTLAWKIRAK